MRIFIWINDTFLRGILSMYFVTERQHEGSGKYMTEIVV